MEGRLGMIHHGLPKHRILAIATAVAGLGAPVQRTVMAEELADRKVSQFAEVPVWSE